MSKFYRLLVWLDKAIWDRELKEYPFWEIVWLLTFGLFVLMPVSKTSDWLDSLNKRIRVKQ